ncbi:MAG: FAD-binding protein [Nitriliruptoraceae bacterium]
MSDVATMTTELAPIVDAIEGARRDQRKLVIRGGGSVLDRLPPTDGEVLATSALTGVVDHRPADLVVTVRAGTPVEELSALLATHGQECPIEPLAGHGSTVGGRLATALAGPRQLQAGRVRDWVLRVRMVTADARVVTAGGVTVKDVTGYDLCRLATGSWGTLGVIVEVTLKLRPIPVTSQWYTTDRPASQVLTDLYRPAAVVGTAEGTFVRLEEHPEDMAAQAAAAGLRAAEPPVLPSTARAAVDPARLSELASWARGAGLTAAGFEGVGVCLLDGDADALAAAGERAAELGGGVLVLDPRRGGPGRGPRSEDAMGLRVRAALDPDQILLDARQPR